MCSRAGGWRGRSRGEQETVCARVRKVSRFSPADPRAAEATEPPPGKHHANKHADRRFVLEMAAADLDSDNCVEGLAQAPRH